MIKRVDHIGVAVRDMESALRLYRDLLGMHPEQAVEIGGDLRVCFLPAGDSAIELLEPIGEASTIQRHIEKRGEGIHHICLEVDDLQATLDELAAAGYRLIDRKPRQGAHGKIAFLHPKDTLGVLLELTQLD